jgi:hypothetical protein
MGRFYQAFDGITGHDDTFTLGHRTREGGYVRCHLHLRNGSPLDQWSISYNSTVSDISMDNLLRDLEALASNLPTLTTKHGQHPFQGFQRPNQVSIEDVTAHLPSEVVRVRVEDVTETIRPTRHELLPGTDE